MDFGVGVVAADQPGMVGVILFITQLLKHYEDKEDTSTIFHLQFMTENIRIAWLYFTSLCRFIVSMRSYLREPKSRLIPSNTNSAYIGGCTFNWVYMIPTLCFQHQKLFKIIELDGL
jgi:uncharacterized protein with PQ loop repeat